MALYEAAAERLKAAGRLYPAYETAEELDRRRKRQQALGKPPIYDRAALKLTDAERAALESQGRKPHWRFKLEPRVVHWQDAVRGASHIDCASLSDPVLKREDGSYLYTLPSVADDIDLGVTHVIRGDDHVTNTAVQIQIFEALGAAAPIFGHHNLLTDAGGEGLSKRTGALSIRSLRDSGVEALAVAALAVLVGSAEAVRPVASLAELAASFDLADISRAAARFDEAELRGLSARLLHHLPFAAVRERLAASGVAGPQAEALWNATRGNLATLAEAAEWRDIVEGESRAARRRSRLPRRGGGFAARRTVGRQDLGRLDRPAQGGDRPQRARPLSPAAVGVDRPRVRPGARRAAAADRPRQSVGSIIRTFRLTPSGPTESVVWP